jgi:hypothetical protein
MIFPRIRHCPFCGSHDVARSNRSDIVEKLVLPICLLRPFRCLTCEERHYDFVYSRRMGNGSNSQRSSNASRVRSLGRS